MANYLKGKKRAYYEKHLSRAWDRTATKGERNYSRAWLSGFSELWDNDGIHIKTHCKNSFEETAYKRGRNFAKKIIEE